jgi:putative membrane protein
VVVAVVAVLVMQAAVDDVVDVITVRYGFVAATFAVNVAVAGVNWMATVRIGFIDAKGVLVVVAVVFMVQMAVVQIIDVAFVFDGSVAAVCAVNVVMMFVGFAGHFFSPNVQ